MWVSRFIVEGKGSFPIDMLRYDHCYPSDMDSILALANRGSSRRVTLGTAHPTKALTGITPARWESFGWRVVSVDKPIKVS